MLSIFKHLKKKELGFMALSFIFIIAQVYLDLKLPDYMSQITQLVQKPGSTIPEILAIGKFMLLCALGSLLASFVVSFLASKTAAGLSMRLRELVFNKTLSFSMEEINEFSTSSLITRSTNDITQIQMLIVMGLQVAIKAPILAAWAIIKISGKSWQWSAATGVSVLLLMILLAVVLGLAVPRFTKIQKLTDNLNRVARENITGIRVVRAYNAEEYQDAKFQEANTNLTDNNLFASRVMAIMFPGMTFIMSSLSLFIYWVGAYLIYNVQGPDKLLLFSDMVVFSSYAMQVILAFIMLSMIFIMLPRALVSTKRINEVLNTKSKIHDGNLDYIPTDKGVSIEFKNVNFKYPDASDYTLRNISFTAKEGETLAIIGSTGSGKTTLLNLIPRFYDASEGEILLNGLNIKNYTQSTLHKALGYVSQKAVLFSGTVKSNLLFGDNSHIATEEDLIATALEISQSSDFVSKMDGKEDSLIAQGGTNVSGGQRQRLSIARAICRKSMIYLFDDTFSALDYKTDLRLRKALFAKAKNSIKIIVAQRIGTIKDADQIIVMDQGEIVGIGTHAHLLANCPVYQEIAYSQLSKEELA